MNANELADKIEDARNETDFQRWAAQAPDMLRQQQAEIANLKAGLLSHHDIYPVKELTDDVAKYHYNKGHEDGRKLVAVKELTNEEMRKVINKIVDGVTVSEMVTFLTISKAILRKAQEK